MPTVTRSQTRSGRPPDRVTFPGEGSSNCPRRLHDSRQDNAVVSDIAIDESPATSVSEANGNQPADSGIHRCNSTRCLTCPKFNTNKKFTSNVTHYNCQFINHSQENLNCHSQNLIYLLSCNNCNIQYVGETAIPLHKRINIHRKAKTGCEYVIKHFKETCAGASFSIQILEKFVGTGYSNNKVDPADRLKRLDREDYWIKTLRTIYPYGLNERVRNSQKDIPVGSLFPSIPRSRQRVVRSRRGRNHHDVNMSTQDFFDTLENMINNEPKEMLYSLRLLLNKFKKKLLKRIATKIMQGLYSGNINAQLEHCHMYILDIIDTKLYKPVKKENKKTPSKFRCTVEFHNKAVELIRLASIFRAPNVHNCLPANMQSDDNIPMVTYKLRNTIRNKILNYKQTVNDIQVDDEVSFSLNTDTCMCNESTFCDPHHKHIVTGDLRIVENDKLRKLLAKGPNYREPMAINYKQAKSKIITALDSCIESFTEDTKHSKEVFQNWKTAVLDSVDQKINILKHKIKPLNTRPVLKDPEVTQYLEQLHRRFVIVPIDKASNNFAFICKSFYISKLLDEVGLNGNPSHTYSKTNEDIEVLIDRNVKLCKKFDLNVDQKLHYLPNMYWIPKLHKNPIGSRFIVASSKCATKPVTSVISNVFKMIFAHIESFHNKSLFYSNYKKFWVVQNSFPIIEKLDKLNKNGNAKNISTFDFSTLYTTLPHNLLIEVLNNLIGFVFKSTTKKKLGFSESSVYFTSKGVGNRYFTLETLKHTVSYLIQKCYFTVGNLVFKQDIGIPMGIDPAPFWANLFLYFYESNFVQSLISAGSDRAFKYHGTNRFIDDLIAINDNNDFLRSFKEIYPPQLELKVEHSGTHATFLDLDITIKDGIFVYKLFDKRDKFPFHIVRMPNATSNIPTIIFYGSIFSEFLRIGRCSLLFQDFIPRVLELYARMMAQGGISSIILKQIKKAVLRYPEVFSKYNMSHSEICKAITESSL